MTRRCRAARIALGSWIVLCCGPLAAAPALAEQGDAAAQAVAHHERGLQLYQASDFAGAAQAFEAAQALMPAPENLFNLARCYERLGDAARAIAAFERYLQADLPPDRRARGEAELARLRAAGGSGASQPQPAPAAEVDLVVVSQPAGAEVLVDGRPHPEPTPTVVPVGPGPHVVEARLAGHADARQDVQVEPGRAGRVELALAPLPPGAEAGGGGEAAPPDSRRLRLTGAASVGGGGSFMIVGEGFGSGGMVSAELAGGLDLGRARSWRRVSFRIVRLELVLGAAAALGGGGRALVEVGGGGRLGLALFRFPLRIEGELVASWAFDATLPDPDDKDNLSVVVGLTLSFQPLPWLEAGLRFLRFDAVLGDVDHGSPDATYRYGLDALVRFRI